MTDTIDDLPRDDTGRITSDYEPTTVEIEVARQAICREFGNNGTDGYYIRILKAINAARPASAALAHPGQVREPLDKPTSDQMAGISDAAREYVHPRIHGDMRFSVEGLRLIAVDAFREGAKWQRIRSALALPLPVQEPVAAYTIDHTGCDHMSRDIAGIERIAAAGSRGPTEVVYLYALALPLPVQEPVASTHEERIALAKVLSWDITEISPDDVKGILAELAKSGFRLSRLHPEGSTDV